jgi:SAM-dependent methyltransferase
VTVDSQDRAHRTRSPLVTGWTDREGAPADIPEPPPSGSYYGPIGDFQGSAYDRNAFALGTAQELAFLTEALSLGPRDRILDVGCGTGRHVRALAAAGHQAVGIDISHGLLAAAAGGPYIQADARALPLRDASADVVLCLCQGGFGITPGGDAQVLAEFARVLEPGGRLALTAFSLAFAVRFMAPEDHIDLTRGVLHSPAEVRGADAQRRHFDMWTTCYSPAHLSDLIAAAGFHLEEISGVEPGHYGHQVPGVRHPELLVLATRA